MCHRGRRNPRLTRPPLKPSSSTGRFFPEHMPRLRPPRPRPIPRRAGLIHVLAAYVLELRFSESTALCIAGIGSFYGILPRAATTRH
jgi:hypothetical protein